ncbi:hypothetical protein DOM22_04840 [Bdellovibrio sp. ZAP7]|uniref:hypothetical protein n=1 Tax=Bdellovibrio sp. ZAP7 TaxID=2231053 RepID=UPI0011571ACD|nr:hypothetical protein [Bdellovibrio sp. ZAP7]QDK44530.1 hypothetical protein DOM22_04840 [Bdellovibrio sp. ZAP7]
MFLTRVLEKKAVIQTFGAALVFAPIGNTLAKMSTLDGVYGQWTFEMFKKVIAAGSVFNQILYVATIAIGFLMLRGSKSVWKFALALLGGYIALQVSDFKHVKSSGLTWTFFLTNIAVFMFIADQLVFKVENTKPSSKPKEKAQAQLATASAVTTAPPVAAKAQAPKANAGKDVVRKLKPTELPKTPGKVVVLQPKIQAKPNSKPTATRKIQSIRKKILFQFEGQNPWGQLVSISSKGIQIKGLKTPPSDITEKEIDLFLAKDLKLRTKFTMKNEEIYFFDYTAISSAQKKELNHWLSSLQDSKAA